MPKSKAQKKQEASAAMPSRQDHEEMIRVHFFFLWISNALEGSPDLLGKAKAVAGGVLDDLSIKYEILYGKRSLDQLLRGIAAEFGQPQKEVKPNDSSSKTKKSRRATKG